MHRELLTSTDVPFFGYVRPQQEPPRLVYRSLVHWHHAARFHEAELHLQAATQPSEVELRRFTLRNRARWRTDWSLVERQILTLGICLMAEQDRTGALAVMPRAQLELFLAPLSLSTGILTDICRAFTAWQAAPRVAVYGSSAVSEGTLGTRLARIHARAELGTLVLPAKIDGVKGLHEWAVANRVPILYCGNTSEKLTATTRHEILQAADTVIVFESRGAQPQHSSVVTAAKALHKRVTIERYDHDTARGGGQIDAFA